MVGNPKIHVLPFSDDRLSFVSRGSNVLNHVHGLVAIVEQFEMMV